MNRSPYEAMEVSQENGVTMVRLTSPAYLEQWLIQAVGDELYKLAETANARVVVDLAAVRQVSSLMIAKLMEFQRRLRLAGGRLAVCSPQQEVQDLFQITHINHILSIYPDREQAVREVGAAG
jgi:anti-anti-sigma factor